MTADTPPWRRVAAWVAATARLARVETAAYLRDKSALFWTFVYPVVLLLLLIALFGTRPVTMKLDVEGRGPGAERLIAALQDRSRHIENVRLQIKRVSADTPTPPGRVRLIATEGGAGTAAPSAVVLKLDSPPDAANGALLALAAETIAQLNLQLAQVPPAIRVDYAVAQRSGHHSTTAGSAAYYVTGLAVLTLVSTALFGFTGPLIELRARGGLKMLQIMPLHRSAFLAGFALCRVMVLSVFSLLFIAAGLALFAGAVPPTVRAWLLLALLVIAGSLAFLAAGLALAGVITRTTVATAVINLLNLPIMFLSDLFIPLTLMPEAVQSAAHWSPVYQLAAAMRAAVADTEVAPFSWISLGMLATLAFAVAATTFRWTIKR